MDTFDPRDLKTKKSSSLDQIRYTNPLMNNRWKFLDVFSDIDNPADESKTTMGCTPSVASTPFVRSPQTTDFVPPVKPAHSGDIRLIEPLTNTIATQGSLRNVFIQSAPHRWIAIKGNKSGESVYSLSEHHQVDHSGVRLDEAQEAEQQTHTNRDEGSLRKMELMSGAALARRNSSILDRFFQGVSKTLQDKEG